MFSLFHDEPVEFLDVDICGNLHLLERAAIWDSAYHVHKFGAENHTTAHDVVYIAQDQVSDSMHEFQICHIAKLVND